MTIQRVQHDPTPAPNKTKRRKAHASEKIAAAVREATKVQHRKRKAAIAKADAVYTKDEALPFPLMLTRAADLLHELQRLESSTKLSCDAFIRDALALCGKTAADLAALDERIQRGPATNSIASFCRKLARALASSNYPSIPIAKQTRMLWQFGDEDVQPQLGIIGANLADAIAIAAIHATQRWPEQFGSVSNADEHKARCGVLRTRLQKLYELLRTSYTSADILTEARSLSEAERKAGHVVQRLKAYPRVHIGLDDWPQQAVKECLAASGGPAPQPQPEPELEVSGEVKEVIQFMADIGPQGVSALGQMARRYEDEIGPVPKA